MFFTLNGKRTRVDAHPMRRLLTCSGRLWVDRHQNAARRMRLCTVSEWIGHPVPRWRRGPVARHDVEGRRTPPLSAFRSSAAHSAASARWHDHGGGGARSQALARSHAKGLRQPCRCRFRRSTDRFDRRARRGVVNHESTKKKTPKGNEGEAGATGITSTLPTDVAPRRCGCLRRGPLSDRRLHDLYVLNFRTLRRYGS
jgi:hypothetical protein